LKRRLAVKGKEKGKSPEITGRVGRIRTSAPCVPNVNSNRKVQQKQCSFLAIDHRYRRLLTGFGGQAVVSCTPTSDPQKVLGNGWIPKPIALSSSPTLVGTGDVVTERLPSAELRCSICRSIVEARVFEPLVTTKRNGLGMGLSICRSIIKVHDGRLWAAPRQPSGSAFRFILPADQPDRFSIECMRKVLHRFKISWFRSLAYWRNNRAAHRFSARLSSQSTTTSSAANSGLITWRDYPGSASIVICS